MDEKKLLAARAANLDAVAMTNKEQPPRARPKLSLSQLTDRAIRPLNREREAWPTRCLIWGVFMGAFQAQLGRFRRECGGC